MFILRFLWAVLTSRWLWTLIGIALFSLVIWVFGPIVRVGAYEPFASENVRIVIIALLVIFWLIWLIVAQRRAIRANRMFVAEIAAPVVEKPLSPGEENVAAVGAKFAEVMVELKRRKLGGRKFLREMPWYVIVGPPATGKTTALRQSGLNFPIDLTDDLQGVGGTRNCDWFFSEHAVLIDTAGRYVQQESQPDVDAAEWLGFLDLLKKHRGRRALNGVIVALSIDVLSEGDEAIKAHGRKIRRRLAELNDRLEIRLPVYLMLTKADLIKGFEAFFGGLSTASREQVWGTTFALDARVDAKTIEREIATLATELERRLVPRLEDEDKLAARAEIFRFPAQLTSLSEPIQVLVEAMFGESRYEGAAWLRGLYLTSATQEGAPIDRLTAALSSSFGLPPRRAMPAPRVEKRSFFLKNLLTEVIFREAGLGTFDPLAQRRRAWIWRGAAAACAAAALLAGAMFTWSYYDNRNAIAAQAGQFEALQAPLTAAAASPASVEQPAIDSALNAMAEVANARTAPPSSAQDLLGPSASAELLRAQADTYEHALRNLLEPHMVALLEATMWRQIRDPDFMLGALKTYRMMTGLSQMDADFVENWWVNDLPEFAPAAPFPTADAEEHQLAAIRRMAVDDSYIAPDQALVAEALKTVCTISLPARAYRQLLADPAVADLKEWIPANFAGPNGAKVFARRSDKTLRVGISGAFTYSGFHDAILDRVEDVAAQAALDRAVFAGGCSENSETSVSALSEDILKLYYEDYIAQWDSILRDIRLAPLADLNVASENLKDLSSADSALKRLLTAVVQETELTRSDEAAPADNKAAAKAGSKLLSKLGKLGKLAKTGAKLLPRAGSANEVDLTGNLVAEHFKPLKGAIAEVDGQPPALDAAVVALTALSNVLQTVTANPDPQDAIKKQGGLAELTGAVARQAQILPDPVDDWLGGIAGDTSGLTQKAVTSELNAIWRADILPFCQAALNDRYPFSPESAVDVNVRDFARLFGPAGMIDTFINDHLISYVDTASQPWKWRADFGLDAAALAAFEQARRIRDDLFPGGTGPVMSFTLQPKDLSPNVTRVTLNLDGQNLVYYNNATRPQPMTWPGKDGTGVISLAFQPIDGSPEVMLNETGSWAWLRLLRSGRFTGTSLSDVYSLRLGTEGMYADFELKAASVENPYNLQMFKKFSCPPQI
ncbi:type VI secretion system membrane subunit TssM [Mesorhizobium sp.]|uniref:type VI secretion system membrane subunit TssM n=1 Tax=Mesorhizobium sp. TaxID=1871066 RepID=UPI000FE6C6CC|nr:type VI secretion system membrane subunit TssM [Mesorhizobium sp.]RWK42161.1 MAG: type VI secretion system membrane subunit TssM [Mesorhizobium sp.]RWK70072.1 MAG: type VI secretion system membrane subunit TssM [Mesorhizobium sp.]RWK73748.1 MAG: type VI secretion system membrane subunit TssM [Mesorhizobium sp.]RWK80013.1 MAG: type VI secretion system membrane subunit TssM [Mesorhizobium sp.]RWL07729.1 MAG: type VI secretion system membrane subunit TssM [Mesorhizobium sp.]